MQASVGCPRIHSGVAWSGPAGWEIYARQSENSRTSCPKTNSHYTIQSFFISIRQLLIVI